MHTAALSTSFSALWTGRVPQRRSFVYLKTGISGEAPTLLLLTSKFILKGEIFPCLGLWLKISCVSQPSKAEENKSEHLPKTKSYGDSPLNLKTIC